MRDSIDSNELGTIALTFNNQPECRVRLMYMSLSPVENVSDTMARIHTSNSPGMLVWRKAMQSEA